MAFIDRIARLLLKVLSYLRAGSLSPIDLMKDSLNVTMLDVRTEVKKGASLQATYRVPCLVPILSEGGSIHNKIWV